MNRSTLLNMCTTNDLNYYRELHELVDGRNINDGESLLNDKNLLG